MDIIMFVQAWLLQAGRKNLEWTDSEGRRFQISSDPQMSPGRWERFMKSVPTPTRRVVGKEEMLAAFEATDEFLFYSLFWDDGENISRDEVMAQVRQTFPGF